MEQTRKKLKWPWIVLITIVGFIVLLILLSRIWPYIYPLTVPKQDEAYQMFAVKNCSGHEFQEEYTEQNGYLCDVNSETKVTTVTIPSEYKKQPVVAVTSSLDSNDTIESLVLEEGILYLERAFCRYGALYSIQLPSSLKAIYRGAFRFCDRLESIEFPADLSVVGYESFQSCKALRQVIFHGDVNRIRQDAFSECPMLETVIFEGAVGCIETGAFANCPNLVNVQLPEGAVVNVGAFSEETMIQIGDGGVYFYSATTYDKDALAEKALELAGKALPEDKKLSEYDLAQFAEIWNGPIVEADRIADCNWHDYDVSKLPEGLSFGVTDVSVIEESYPGTVFTADKEKRTVNGEMPLVYCICELIGYSEGPEYTFTTAPANYIAYRYSFWNASDGELLGWCSCTAGDAPGMYTFGDQISYEKTVGEDTMQFFLDENGKIPTPLRHIEKLVYGLPHAE